MPQITHIAAKSSAPRRLNGAQDRRASPRV
jgi:hypothetical protein